MKNSDVELIHRILEGDESAFSTLVEKYQKQVHALAWRKIGDFHIAEEITQDTFLKAYQKLSSLKNPQRFAGWLYVIATRCCQAWLRKKHIETESLEEVDNDTLEPEAYSRYVSEEKTKVTVAAQRQVVKKLLATLPESERTVITLHYFGEMTCESISEFLGVSANTIKSRLRRARNRLKQEEPMIREAIANFKISPTLTDNIMQEVSQLKPAAPSTSKPIIPWVIGATGAVLIALMFGIGGQFLAHFQKPYSLDAQSERSVKLVEAQVVQNLDVESDNRNQPGNRTDLGNRSDGNEENTNQVIGDGDYTRWNLPEGAKQRLGKGILNDMQLSADGTRLAIASSIGVWLYDVRTGHESALLTKNLDFAKLVRFSPDGKTLISAGNGNTIRSWDVESGKLLLTFNSLSTSLSTLKFSPNGKTLIGVNSDGKVWFCNINTGEHLNTFSLKTAEIRTEIDGTVWNHAIDVFVDQIGVVTYAIGNKDGTIRIQNGQTGLEIRTLTQRTHDADFFILQEEAEKPLNVKITINKGPLVGHRSRTVRDPSVDPKEYQTIYKDDGTPFPIQYRFEHLSFGLPVMDERPMKWLAELKFSPEGKTLASKSVYRTIRRDGWGEKPGPIEIWDVDTGEQLAALKPSWVKDVKFSGDGKTLAIIGIAGCVIWDVDTRSKIATFPQSKDVMFTDLGKTLTIIEHDRYTIWDIETRRETTTLSPTHEQFERLVLSPDGSLLATTDGKGVVNIWETKNNTEPQPLTSGYTNPFTVLAFSHDGKTLASGDNTGNIQLWDTDTQTKRITIKAGKNLIGGLAFSKDSTILTSVSNADLIVWNVATGEKIATHTLPKAASRGGTLSFVEDVTASRLKAAFLTPMGNTLVTRRSKTEHSVYEIWDLTTDNPKRRPIEFKYQWGPIALSPDGSTFANSDRKGEIFLWDANTGNRLATLSLFKNFIDKLLSRYRGDSNVCTLAFAPDGKTLLIGTGKDKEIQLWDLATYQKIGTLTAHKHAICELAFSPDGTLLASGDTGGKIHLWDYPTRSHLTTYTGHEGYVCALAFTPDGKTLASINDSVFTGYKHEGTIYLWKIPSK